VTEQSWRPGRGFGWWLLAGAWASLIGSGWAALAGFSTGRVRLVAFVLAGVSLAVVVAACVVTTVLYRRATGKWPITWHDVRQRVPAYLRAEFRIGFGHKRWHKVALIVLIGLAAILGSLVWAASRSGS
jgi:hypothetical protein